VGIITAQRLVRNLESYPTQWPFGFGLTYTTFEYSNLSISTNSLIMETGDESITVQLAVTNGGLRDGTDILQLYLTEAGLAPSPQPTEPNSQINKYWMLKRFLKVDIDKGLCLLGDCCYNGLKAYHCLRRPDFGHYFHT